MKNYDLDWSISWAQLLLISNPNLPNKEVDLIYKPSDNQTQLLKVEFVRQMNEQHYFFFFKHLLPTMVVVFDIYDLRYVN